MSLWDVRNLFTIQYVGCNQRENIALYFIIPLANKALCRHYGK